MLSCAKSNTHVFGLAQDMWFIEIMLHFPVILKAIFWAWKSFSSLAMLSLKVRTKNSIKLYTIPTKECICKTVSSESSQNGQLSRLDNAKSHELWLPESLWKGDTTDPTQEIKT